MRFSKWLESRVPTILFVCTGNTCRSPMAESLARKMLGGQANVISAGTKDQVKPASKNAVEAIGEVGLDISGHQSQQINAALLDQADLIFVMEPQHANLVLKVNPNVESKITSLDIANPYGKDLSTYRETLKAIKSAIQAKVLPLMG